MPPYNTLGIQTAIKAGMMPLMAKIEDTCKNNTYDAASNKPIAKCTQIPSLKSRRFVFLKQGLKAGLIVVYLFRTPTRVEIYEKLV